MMETIIYIAIFVMLFAATYAWQELRSAKKTDTAKPDDESSDALRTAYDEDAGSEADDDRDIVAEEGPAGTLIVRVKRSRFRPSRFTKEKGSFTFTAEDQPKRAVNLEGDDEEAKPE